MDDYNFQKCSRPELRRTRARPRKLVHFKEEVEVFVFSSSCISHKRNQNSVKFHKVVHVFVIPSRDDFAMWIPDLWYKRSDFFDFEVDAYSELQQFYEHKNNENVNSDNRIYQCYNEILDTSTTSASDHIS